MANAAEIFAGFIVVLICSTLLFQVSGRYIYNYRITGRGIEIVLFGTFPIKRVPFGNIAEIQVGSTRREMLPFKGVAFGNRVWGRTVVVRQKAGAFTLFI